MSGDAQQYEATSDPAPWRRDLGLAGIAVFLVAIPWFLDSVVAHDFCARWHWLLPAGWVGAGLVLMWAAEKALGRLSGCATILSAPIYLALLFEEGFYACRT